ncbi:MAG: S-layer homology domain-containing protein [Gammaproteobacteria bacterium]|nr:S-layer homology domain-containing protein [Gammaproteobacteria bacterium]
MAVSLMVTAPTFAAAFADVPFDHWAYQAVEELAQAGVLEGYPDGLYRRSAGDDSLRVRGCARAGVLTG